jgi:hypothetical protein
VQRLRASPPTRPLIPENIMFRYLLLAVVSVALIAGCSSDQQKKDQAAAQAKRDAEVKKKKGIFGKTTQDIGKFDPNAGHTVVDSKIRATTPGSAALESYGPLVQKAAGLAVQQRVEHFNALNGKYPTYVEFMSQIVKNEQAPLRLPVLPGKKKYYYNEADHSIVVVDPNPPDGAKQKE